MGFDAGTAVSEAMDRITTQVALVVMGLYAAASIVQVAAFQDIVRVVIEDLREILREEGTAEEYQEFVDATDPVLNDLPLALGLDLVPALLVIFFALIAATVVVALAIDAFARNASRVGELDASRLVWNTINIVVGGIVYFVLMWIGFGFFVLPGLAVLVLFLFFPIAVVVEEENFFSAFGSSIETVTDNVGQTLLLGLLALVVASVAVTVSWITRLAIPGAVGWIASTAITAVTAIFLVAMLTRAYVAGHADDPPEDEEDFGAAESWN